MTRDDRLSEVLLRWEGLRAQGQITTPEELCQDCPEVLQEARSGIRALQTVDTVHGRSLVGTAAAVPLAAVDQRAFGHYVVLRELGRGGMGVVYLAYDRKRKEAVALKTLSQLDPASLYRLKQEFRSLEGVSHPNLVGLYELIAAELVCFFTMELVEGVNFLAHVRRGHGSPPHPERLRESVRQLATGLAALHGLGKIHRDLKPSNVLVTPGGRVVLLDLGLAAELNAAGIHESTEQHVLGTIGYMAPEQAVGLPLIPACDCYSLGVMLYEALTGRLPFQGRPHQVLRAKQHEDPPFGEVAAGVDRDLNDLCVALLRRAPESRPTATDVLRLLGSSPARPAQPQRSVFVGREPQLADLASAYAALRGGKAGLVCIAGRSGAGKSMLAQHFLAQLEQQGEAVVLAGKCHERESVPFKAIDSLIDALSRYLRQLPTLEAQSLLPRGVHLLARLFPVLGRVEAVAEAPGRATENLDAQELRRRSFDALRELLARIGDRRPLVLFADDLQWGDVDGVTQLIELFRPPDAPVLLLVACYRSEEAEANPCLRLLRRALEREDAAFDRRQVGIEPLGHEEARSLALLLFSRSDRAAQAQAEAVARESGGNPYFVHVLVQCLSADAGFAEGCDLTLDEVLWSRIRAMPEEPRRLLGVIAASGQPMDLAEACQAAGPISDEHGALTALRAGRLIRMTGQADREEVETYHDRVRETVLAHLGAEEVRGLHRVIALVLEGSLPVGGSSRGRSLDLAYHFDAAGESARALPHALAMAEQARSQYALEIAERMYRIAERGAAGSDEATRYRVAEGLGHVLMLRGNYPEAALRFEAALPLTTDVLMQSRIECNLGELVFKCGDMQAAIEAYEGALRKLGNHVPRWSLGFSLLLCREMLVQTLHTLFPGLFLGRTTPREADKQLLTVRLHNRMCYAYWFGKSKTSCLWTHLRGMNLAERYPPTRELAQAYSIHAPVMSLVPYVGRGVAYAQKSWTIYLSVGDVWGQGQALHFHGIVLYVAARYEEAIEILRESMRLLERIGDYWEVNVARYHTALCHYRLGDLGTAASLAKEVHLSGLELGDIQAAGVSLDVWVLASGGKVSPTTLQAELERPRGDVQVTAQLMLAEGARLFMAGRFEEAAALFEAGHRRAVDTGIHNAYVLPLRSWLAAALRQQALAEPSTNTGRRSLLLRRASRVARKAVRVARAFHTDLPHALREAALIAAIRGSTRRARRDLDESIAVAQRQGARFEHAQTLQARGRLGLAAGWPNAQADLDAAHAALHALGADFAIER